jgi:hypothetical protein
VCVLRDVMSLLQVANCWIFFFFFWDSFSLCNSSLPQIYKLRFLSAEISHVHHAQPMFVAFNWRVKTICIMLLSKGMYMSISYCWFSSSWSTMRLVALFLHMLPPQYSDHPILVQKQQGNLGFLSLKSKTKVNLSFFRFLFSVILSQWWKTKSHPLIFGS